MTEKLLLEIIVFQLGALMLLAGRIWHNHEKKHDTIDEKIDALNEQRTHCSEIFASKEAVARAHTRLDDHDEDLSSLKISVTRLEGRG